MKVLFLSGVFAAENESEIIAHSKAAVEYSANIFQEKMISGFLSKGYDTAVLSAPFIGAFPVKSDVLYFNGFKTPQNKYGYVKFCNVWGLRNFSRASSLKKAIKGFADAADSEKLIVVYSPHTPFLEAAVYAKKRDPRIKITIVVPDLPQYMNLNSRISLIYKLGKKLDIAKFDRLLSEVDSFVVLTEHMKKPLKVGNRPCAVVEGIVDPDVFSRNEQEKKLISKESGIRYIVYTGKLSEKFGISLLLDAFSLMKDDGYRLVLCGRGEMDEYVKEQSRKDTRIIALGQVTPDVAREWVLKADVLVNPRPNNEEYTKYSFPSKNIEYLSSGNPLVAYMLDGMPSRYKEYISEIRPGGSSELKDALESALKNGTCTETEPPFFEYARNHLSSDKIAEKIAKLNGFSGQEQG